MNKTYLGIGVGAILLIVGGVLLLNQNNAAKPNPSIDTSTINNSASVKPDTAKPEEKTSVSTKQPAEAINLDISSPTDKSVTKTAKIQVKGKTSPKAEVTVNDQDLKADSGGNFSTSLNLDEGENFIVVTAASENGSFAEKELTVTYETAGQ